MSNWGGRSSSNGGDPNGWFERARPAYLIIVTVALLALGGAMVAANRYEIGVVGPLPIRLDRFTGQVIGCVPQRGCVELVPAGQPQLATVSERPPSPAPAPGATPAPAKPPTPEKK